MVIHKNTQLGLMMDDDVIKLEFLRLQLQRNETLANAYKMICDILDNKVSNDEGNIIITNEEIAGWTETTGKGFGKENDLQAMKDSKIIETKINDCFLNDTNNFVDNENSRMYLICNGVEQCSKMIRIGDNFSSKALRNIAFGKHTYLLGKHEVCRFICASGAIKGIYWDRQNEVTFEFGFDLTGDGYYFDELYSEQFNKVAKIITFVELGDIEVIELEKGRNNGKPKKDGKITNTSNFTVYVVDSTWNQLIIRTEGFAVMGHYRLQSCGIGHSDRKLIWISAFEKHGYKRRPKAEILNN